MTRDKEKTPVIASEKVNSQNVISRLESKYSDILDRVAKRKEKQRQQLKLDNEDRDKTLEPLDNERRMPAPLMKSATTANILNNSKASSQKERTPFRLDRHKNKYNADIDSVGKMKRSDVLASASSNDFATYSKLKSHDSGYYDGSYYKSKYDDLLSDVTNNRHTPRATQAYTGSSTSRQLKPYKRTDGSNDKHRTAINLYDMLDNDQPQSSYKRQYSKQKSAGFALRSTAGTYNDSTTDDSSDDFSDFEKTERENRRKEIQSLIMKYAQLDDFYGNSKSSSGSGCSNNNNHNNNNDNHSNNKVSSSFNPWDTKVQSPIVIPKKNLPNKSTLASTSSSLSSSLSSFNALGKSQTMANVNYYQTSNYNDDDDDDYNFDSSWYRNYSSKSNKTGNVVPITTNIKSTSKSRLSSKALSTFVRVFVFEFFFL
jgi:hypothetical protein